MIWWIRVLDTLFTVLIEAVMWVPTMILCYLPYSLWAILLTEAALLALVLVYGLSWWLFAGPLLALVVLGLLAVAFVVVFSGLETA